MIHPGQALRCRLVFEQQQSAATPYCRHFFGLFAGRCRLANAALRIGLIRHRDQRLARSYVCVHFSIEPD
jgi:hypothetical protein